ncbi:FMN-binding negative transcriptional regulator [Azohydromonas lata]|uniref:FMN-binding negative transcriptional regulator n=1 Tax=Azohydromonas lata TaxID=45677 RepID=A0ABU5IHU5_9BURK|nr:FMN-binding negative transcriptional regulator [Azohydromonas lata]MDZ5458711.1 FMN-binding negative transcriptional regulator [Azohydromonas lata]
MATCAFHYQEYTSLRADLIDQMISQYPLALVCSEYQGVMHASHIPLFRDADRSLFGHVDRRNLQFQGRGVFPAKLVFMGPQSYIPPEAYHSRQLPTWNYVSVHMDVKIQVVDHPEAVQHVLHATAARLQPADAPYQFDAADSRVIKYLPHILGLRIHSHHEEGRFKLSQDKPHADREAALEYLLQQHGACRRELMATLLNFSECARAE